MKIRSRRFVLVLSLPLWLALLVLGGCQLTDWKKARDYRNAFEEAAPKPDWWDRVATDTEIKTYDELLAYWQNNHRTDNQFFKAAYQAILDYPLDADLVVNAINLLPHADRGYPHTTTMCEFAIERHFDYNRPLNGYAGKPGDCIAGIARDLSRIYNGTGNYMWTIELLERLFEKRQHEINDQMLELLTLDYAEALYDYGQTDEAVAVLESAIKNYNGDWENRLEETLNRYRGPR
jgi:tetratricopeptide (TPR) repeat protein